jgi:hypothetical protein
MKPIDPVSETCWWAACQEPMTDRWWPYCAAHWQDSQREVHDALQELEDSDDRAGASVEAVVSHPKTAPFTTDKSGGDYADPMHSVAL